MEEKDPQARRVYRRFAGGRWGVPDIFKAMADGDGRFLLNLCEELFALAPESPLDTTALVGTVQRRATSEKKDDIDALLSVVTQLSRSITQVVRLHHQIWKEDAPPEEVIATIHRLLGLDEERIATEETP